MSGSDSKAPEEAARKVPAIPGVSDEVFAFPGMTEEDMRKAMEYPGAAAEVERVLEAERTSVSEGDPAPEFRLARLTGAEVGARVALSDHFGKRPVALVFGSYT